MRLAIAVALAASCAGTALAQTSSPSSGGPAGGGTPSTTSPPASSSPPPATPSQRNLDTRPPATSLPPGQTTAPPPPAVLQPSPGGTAQPKSALENRPAQDDVPPSAGKRPTPGGAGSSELSRTGKNPANETYQSCLSMWEAATHMTRQEWARACRRVENRLQDLRVDLDVERLKTGSAATRRRRE